VAEADDEDEDEEEDEEDEDEEEEDEEDDEEEDVVSVVALVSISVSSLSCCSIFCFFSISWPFLRSLGYQSSVVHQGRYNANILPNLLPSHLLREFDVSSSLF